MRSWKQPVEKRERDGQTEERLSQDCQPWVPPGEVRSEGVVVKKGCGS